MAEIDATSIKDEADTLPDDADELFLRAKRRIKDSWHALGDWYKEAKEDFEFVAGHQWDEKTKRLLEDKMRPASVFNMVGAMIRIVAGYEVSNRQEIRFIPKKLGSSGVSEVVTSAEKYFRDGTDAEDVESAAFRDAAMVGLGWTETYVDFDDDPNGHYTKKRVPYNEMIWDSHAREPNLADRRWNARIRTLSLEDALNMIPEDIRRPDVTEADFDADWLDGDPDDASKHHDNPTDRYSGDSTEDAKSPDREVRVVDYQWWEFQTVVRFVDPFEQKETTIAQDQFRMLSERMLSMGQQPPRGVVQRQKVYLRAFMGKCMLTDPQPVPAKGHFTYQAITGEFDETKGFFFGIVRPMKDPQRWTNKLFSQTMHILNTNANGGLFAERGAFENDAQAARDHAKPDKITWMNQGGLARVQPKQPTQINPAFFQLIDFAMNMGPKVSGINMEFMGTRQVDQPGVLEHQRRQAAVTSLATLFDSLRLYRKRAGRMDLVLMQEYLSDGRMIQIVGEEEQMFLPLRRDFTLGEFDIMVDDAPSSPNQKEKNWQIIQSMMPIMGKAMESKPQLIGQLVKYSPLPESLGIDIAKAFAQGPDPEAEAAKKAAAYAKINVDNSTAEKNRAAALSDLSATFVQPMMAPATLQPLDGPFPVAPAPGAALPPGMKPPQPGIPGAQSGPRPPMPGMMPPQPPQGAPPMPRPPMPGVN